MNVVVSAVAFCNNSVLRDEAKKVFLSIKFNEKGSRLTKEELIKFIGNSEAIIVGLDQLDNEVLTRCSNLKYISKYGVGLDNIDLDFCKQKGIQIGWVGGVNKTSVAELTIGYMISLCRNLYTTSNLLKQGTWHKSGGRDLSNKIIGIIGVGHIGKEVIRLLKPFNCKILVNDIIDQKVYYSKNGLFEVSKKELINEADIISIHTPLNTEMLNYFNLDRIKKMRSSSFLINTARGKIIVQDDLKKALKMGIISGAAVDVYDTEPPNDLEFLSIPNLLTTPHIGGNSFESVLAMGRSAITELIKLQLPINI